MPGSCCTFVQTPLMKIILILSCLLYSISAYSQKLEDYWLSYTDTSSGESLSGYKKKDGTIAIPARYLWVDTDTFYHMAIVFDKGWVGIDREGKVVLNPFIYDNGPDYVVEGLFRFEENGKMGFANRSGNKIIPARYSFITPFSGGLSEYTLGGYKKYDEGGEHWTWTGGYEQGYVNQAGQEFTKIVPAKHGRHEAWTKEGRHLLLNNNGMVIGTLSK